MPWSVQIVEPVFLEETHMVKKSVAVAALLSIVFPGIGHFYIGLNQKGIMFIVAYIVSAILILLFIGFYIGYCCLDLGINRCD